MNSTLAEHIKKLKSMPDLVVMIQLLVDEIVRLRDRVQELEGQINKNSRNSSQPPSSDGYQRVAKNNRVLTGKNQGSQEGHQGNSLKFSPRPDALITALNGNPHFA